MIRPLQLRAPLFTLWIALLVPAWAEAPAASDAGFISHLARQINDYRARQGLAPLEIEDRLTAIAGEHSAMMASQRRLSHDGFTQRLRQTTSRLCVENVGWNYPTAESQLEGWRHSPSHDRNLVDPKVTRMGLSTHQRYVTFFACR